MEINH